MSGVVTLLGLDFASTSASQAAAWIASRPDGAPFEYVVTPNADHMVRLTRDPELHAIYQGALLRLLDSRVVSGIARVLGLRPPCVACGSDLTVSLLAHHLRPRERITIIGLQPQWMSALEALCGLSSTAHYNPPIGFERDPAELDKAVRFVLEHPSRFVFLAVGSPRQEILAMAIQATGKATGTGLCIGAGLEFLAGARMRAPRWMRRAGLEWLFRLLQEPRRLWRRYLVRSPEVILFLAAQRWRELRSGS